MFSRRVLLSGALVLILPFFGRGDDKPVKKDDSSNDLPPGHRPMPEHRSYRTLVTADMKTKVTAYVGDLAIFTGQTKDLTLKIFPAPWKPKSKTKDAKTLSLNTKELAKIPEGELSLDGVLLTSPDNIHDWAIQFDELHLPGAGVRAMEPFQAAMRSLDPNSPKPSLTIEMEDGRTLLMEGVTQFNPYICSGDKNGIMLGNLGVRAKAIYLLK